LLADRLQQALMGTKTQKQFRTSSEAKPFQVFRLLARANSQSFETREIPWFGLEPGELPGKSGPGIY
jgi:hypothetical protein